MKPNIFICGPSGTGKSTSLRNLDPETTVILNTEQKALPFRGANKFKFNASIKDLETFEVALSKALANPAFKVIVIESFTSLFEHIVRKAQSIYSGFDVWDFIKKKVGEILNISKNTEKYIVFLGVDMVIDGASGVEERCIAIDGSWKKKVEKEFVIVAFTDAYEEDNTVKYRFVTNKTQGFTKMSCKSPMEMLPVTMENDVNALIVMSEEFYNSPELINLETVKPQ